MVRLQHRKKPERPLIVLHFNPTMVRLQPGVLNGVAVLPQISIPLWCDCNKVKVGQLFRIMIISIPLWCDCNGFELEPASEGELISIPLWCDCNMMELGEPPAASESGEIDTVLVALPRHSWRRATPPASVPISEEAVNEVATIFGVGEDAARRALQLGFEGHCNTTVGATGSEDANET